MFKLAEFIQKNIFKILLLMAMLLFYIHLQNKGIELQVKKRKLQREIEVLKTKHIIIASELMQLTLQGRLEEELKKHGYKISNKTSLPKVIYVKEK